MIVRFNWGQLALRLDDEPPKNAEELQVRLRALGLGTMHKVKLTRNRNSSSGRFRTSGLRSVRASFSKANLRIASSQTIYRRLASRTVSVSQPVKQLAIGQDALGAPVTVMMN
mgnify:CR=1 FL=1